MKKYSQSEIKEKTATVRDGVRELIADMNIYSKWIIRIGSILVAAVYTAALLVRVAAGRYIDYYYAVNLCAELLYCGKECVGAVYVPALLLELFDMAGGK